MLKRSEVQEKYKWDLSSYFLDLNHWQAEFNQVKNMYEKLTEYEGNLGDDARLLECLKLDKEINEITARLYVYISLKIKEDAKVEVYQDKANKLDKYLSDISPRLSFLTSEINEIDDERLLRLANDKNFADFDLQLKNVIRNKPHTLNKEQEKLLSMVSECIGGAEEVFDMIDAVDIKFEDIVDSNGQKFPLNNANYSVYLRSEDQVLRGSAFKNLNGGYGKLNYSLSTNYMNNVKTDCTMAKVRKFDSAFKQALFGEEVDEKVYKTLIKQVNKHKNVFQRYFNLKKKALNLETFYNYDVNAKLKTKHNKKYTYDEAFDIVKNSLNVLGGEYTNILQKAKDERWIDVMPNENKDTGAFSWGAYGANPVVLLNYEETINSVFTLAHELGHMMHTYYSNNNNVSTKAGYEIFVAEVASTTNELILARTLLNNKDEDIQTKLFYIDYLMNTFYGTIFRQTMFAEFEYLVHDAYENGENTTTDALNNIYMDLCKNYFGENVELVDELKYEWSRIPHFYTSFYVYKYATGIISALALANKILDGDTKTLQSYKNFLKSGCTKPPVELLKDAGVDLTKQETFESAFEYISKVLDTFEDIK